MRDFVTITMLLVAAVGILPFIKVPFMRRYILYPFILFGFDVFGDWRERHGKN